jgi:predicted ATP-grasp superfamily ATP-dependent carboligase
MRRQRVPLDVDRAVPALLLKVGYYPIHHGSVGAVRSLGKLGIEVYAVTEDRFTPTALSRYLKQSLVWPTSGAEDAQDLVAGLMALGERIGKRAVLVPTDDEAALLAAEHADVLEERFILPDVAPGLPRQLASKSGLAELCQRHGAAAPRCLTPHSAEELRRMAAEIGFPVVLKNDQAWLRLINPAVASTTVVADMAELERLMAGWISMPSVVVQEYLPREHAEDWIVHIYVGKEADSTVVFTGIKLRSWPPHAGVTAVARSLWNADLARRTVEFCNDVGFRGIADLDWRLDNRDGVFRLLDFNPRLGAQFQMFETEDGVDVVRALHLDLTGRARPTLPQVDGRRFVIEHLAVPAALAYRRMPGPRLSADANGAVPSPRRKRAWSSAQDPVPAFAVAVRLGFPAARRLTTMIVRPHVHADPVPAVRALPRALPAERDGALPADAHPAPRTSDDSA